jgi:hypothetical protein
MIDTCVCCGRYVPEGSLVCSLCLSRYVEKEGKTYANNGQYDSFELRSHPAGVPDGISQKDINGKLHQNVWKTGKEKHHE